MSDEPQMNEFEREGQLVGRLREVIDKATVETLLAMLNDPNIVITIVPKGADKISEFLARVGRVKARPDNWKDYYFGDVDKLKD